jgi:predicted transcriptional regulator
MGSEVLQLLQKIEAKTITSIEELTKLIDEDFKGIAHLCLIIEETTLKTAGFAVGLFDDARKQQTTINPENKN